MNATRDDIFACFRLLLGREPGPDETAAHMFYLGMPLDRVVSSYLGSLEFRNRNLTAGDAGAEEVRLDGYSVYVAKDDILIAPVIRAGYEPEVTQVFLDHLGTGLVIDVGANCGHFTMLAASRGAAVYAFEPLLRNVRLLHAGAVRNGFQSVRIIAAAASDLAGTLVIGASHTDGMVGEAGRNGVEAALSADYVAAVRIDDMVPRDRPVSLIKIDVEGHEYRALKGAMRTIAIWDPVILSEFAPAWLASSGHSGIEYLELLRGAGYSLAVVGRPEVTAPAAILELCGDTGHVDLLATPNRRR